VGVIRIREKKNRGKKKLGYKVSINRQSQKGGYDVGWQAPNRCSVEQYLGGGVEANRGRERSKKMTAGKGSPIGTGKKNRKVNGWDPQKGTTKEGKDPENKVRKKTDPNGVPQTSKFDLVVLNANVRRARKKDQ